MLPLVPIIGIAGKILDKIFPDPAERAKAEATLQRAQVDGDLAMVEQQLSAIIMEAQSKDKWTSRARPGFLYVVYTYLLAGIPYGILFALQPETAGAVAEGVGAWFASIPGDMWTLFGIGYVGYVGARTADKKIMKSGKFWG